MTLDSIIERLEKAQGGDRDIDLAIHSATEPPLRNGFRFGKFPHVTSSVDAAIALAEKVLQGAYSMKISTDPSGCGTKIHHWPNGLSGEDEIIAEGVSQTMALSACLAILKAKQMGVGE